jgi:hypothetical protein
LNGDADGSDALCKGVYTVYKVFRLSRSLTILGKTELVEVPHDKFAVPRTREDLVVISWVIPQVSFPSL